MIELFMIKKLAFSETEEVYKDLGIKRIFLLATKLPVFDRIIRIEISFKSWFPISPGFD